MQLERKDYVRKDDLGIRQYYTRYALPNPKVTTALLSFDHETKVYKKTVSSIFATVNQFTLSASDGALQQSKRLGR